MKRRSTFSIMFLGIALVAISLAGLSNNYNIARAQAKKVRIALILIGPQNDGSWAEAAVTALNKLKDAGYDTAVKESVADTDVERVMRSYIDDGYNAIIAHSFSFQDAVFKVAADHPEINFIWAGCIDRTAKNVGDYAQPFYEGAYLAGIVAAKLSQS